MNERIRAMVEKRTAALQKARALLDKAAAEERDLTTEEQAQYDGWDSEIDSLSAQINREERLSEREAAAERSLNGDRNPVLNRQPGGQSTGEGDGTESRDYRQSVVRYLIDGERDGVARFDSFGGETRTIMGVSITGTGATGGVLAPTVLERTLLDYVKNYNIMRRLATVRSSTSDIDIPYTTTHTQAYHITEGNDFTKSTPAWNKTSMKAYKVGALTVVTHEAMQDMFIDLEGWIRDDFGDAFAALEEHDFFKGSGTGEPTGVISSATQAGEAVAAITADTIIDVAHSLERKYRDKAVWVMNDSTIKLLRKLKLTNTGDYIWQPGLQAGQPDRLLGKPVYTSNEVDEAATKKAAILYGDFSRYRILDRRGLYFQRLNELYATSGQVGYLAYRRYDGKLLDTAAVKKLVMA